MAAALWPAFTSSSHLECVARYWLIRAVLISGLNQITNHKGWPGDKEPGSSNSVRCRTDGERFKQQEQIMFTERRSRLLVRCLIQTAFLFFVIAITTQAQTLWLEKDYKRALDRFNKGDFDGAINDLDRVIGNLLKDRSAFSTQGFDNGHEITQSFGRIVVIVPGVAAAYFNRGLAYYAKQEFDSAIADLEQATSIAPRYAEAFANLGAARHAKGDLDRVIADYTQAVRLRPACASAYHNRGLARYLRKDVDLALEDFNRAVELDSKNAQTYLNRGIVWFDKGNWEKALADYNRAVEINPNLARAYNNRGNVHLVGRNLKAAIEDYERALQYNPKLTEAYLNRGIARVMQGRDSEAEKDFDRARALNPEIDLSIDERVQQVYEMRAASRMADSLAGRK